MARRVRAWRALIENGAARLAKAGVQLLSVLGDPAFYTRCGFGPALPLGLHAPYAIEPAAAWMVRALAPGVLGKVQGTVACAKAMATAGYWREQAHPRRQPPGAALTRRRPPAASSPPACPASPGCRG